MSWDYDVVIIGAGVCGCAIARELSRYQVNACVIEKEEDVCGGTSKADSGIVHAGYTARAGSLMARLSVEGNALMESLAQELDFPFDRRGSLLVCHDEEGLIRLKELYDRGVENGVEELAILTGKEARELEPNLADTVYAALYAPTTGVVCPFGMTVALAENAAINGIDFHFNTRVTHIEVWKEGYKVYTPGGSYRTLYVVNAAGVEADTFHHMVSSQPMHITSFKEEYFLLDKMAGEHTGMTVFALQAKEGEEILVSPTVHGNLLVGSTVPDMQNEEGTEGSIKEQKQIFEQAKKSVKDIPLNEVISSFTGLCAQEAGHDFYIRELKDARGFIDCAGIGNLGLSGAPAIGELLAGFLQEKMELVEKDDFIAGRRGILNPTELSQEERNKLVQKEPAYGNIICRCEGVSEGEIVDAINRPLGACSPDGVKKRVRAGMGRCQGDFCTSRIVEIIDRECGLFNVD